MTGRHSKDHEQESNLLPIAAQFYQIQWHVLSKLPFSYQHPCGGVCCRAANRHPTPLLFDDPAQGAFVNFVTGAKKI
jgi:hypothetical protein